MTKQKTDFRTRRIILRVSDKELKQINKLRKGKTLSEYVREKLFYNQLEITT